MRLLKTAALAATLAGTAGVGAAVQPVGHAQDVRVAGPRDVQVYSLSGGRIGVAVSELEEADTKTGSGVRVDSVDEGSPAEKAGLRKGDVVVEFDGERVRSVRQFTRLVTETPVGRTVTAVAMRDGQRVTMSITPRENDGVRLFGGNEWRVLDELKARRAPAPLPPTFETFFRGANQLGVTVNTLTDQLGEYFGTKVGVLVTSVQEDSLASRIGGIPEVVTDNETGFMSEIGNTEKMSDDVVKLLSDEEMRREFGKKARESAVSRYSTEKIIPQYIAFYEKVLNAKT